MKLFSKIKWAVLLAALLCVLTACQKQSPPEEEEEPPKKTETTEPEPPKTEEPAATVESRGNTTEKTADDGFRVLTAAIGLPEVKTPAGQTPMNLTNYYDNLMEKYTIAVEDSGSTALTDYQDSKGTERVFIPYDMEYDFTVTCNRRALLSFCRTEAVSSGGVHGSKNLRGENWVFRDGDFYLLTLEDCFEVPETAKEAVFGKVAQQAAEKAKEEGYYYENYQELLDSAWQGDFYLTGSALYIVYQEYALGPYVSGTQIFELPFAELPNLKTELK